MKSTVLVIVVVVTSAAILFWAYGNLRVPMARMPDVEPASVSPAAEAPKEKPKVKPLPKPVEEPVQAEVTAPPPAVIAPKPALPFPKLEDISIGADRTNLLETYHEPTLRSVSNQKGNLMETYIYASGGHAGGSAQETWVVLRNGTVAAKFTSELTPVPGVPEVRR